MMSYVRVKGFLYWCFLVNGMIGTASYVHAASAKFDISLEEVRAVAACWTKAKKHAYGWWLLAKSIRKHPPIKTVYQLYIDAALAADIVTVEQHKLFFDLVNLESIKSINELLYALSINDKEKEVSDPLIESEGREEDDFIMLPDTILEFESVASTSEIEATGKTLLQQITESSKDEPLPEGNDLFLRMIEAMDVSQKVKTLCTQLQNEKRKNIRSCGIYDIFFMFVVTDEKKLICEGYHKEINKKHHDGATMLRAMINVYCS